jgi:hypothetical protein
MNSKNGQRPGSHLTIHLTVKTLETLGEILESLDLKSR